MKLNLPRLLTCTECGGSIKYDEVRRDGIGHASCLDLHDDILFLDGQRVGRAEATGAILCSECEETT